MTLVLCAAFPAGANASDYNCTLRQNSNFVNDHYGMYDAAENTDECLLICREYANSSVNSLADSDVITDLSWTCKYNDEDIHTEILVEDGKRHTETMQ